MTRRSLFAAAMAAALPQLTEAQSMPAFRVTIGTAQHKHQRYATVGDWQTVEDRLIITVSEMPDWRYMALVAAHELVEAVLCLHRGIDEAEITAWDKQFAEDMAHDRKVMEERLDELRARVGEGPSDEMEESDLEADLAEVPAEPGDHPGACYHAEHMFATKVEEMLAKQLGVSWEEYEKALEAL
jgi:hypothetical protein